MSYLLQQIYLQQANANNRYFFLEQHLVGIFNICIQLALAIPLTWIFLKGKFGRLEQGLWQSS